MLSTGREFLGAGMLVAALLVSTPCAAADSDPPDRVRAGAQIAGFLAVDWALLYAGPAPVADPPGNVPFMDKLTLKAWSFDASSYLTNFGAHPLAGTFYYTTARSNRLGPFESLGWAMLSSLTWEMAEFPENVSFNDLVMTPIGGASIGESLVQLSLWLDRKPTLSRRVLSGILFPMKLVNGSPPVDSEETGGFRGEMRLVGGGKAGGAPTLGVRMATRLVHFRGYGEPGGGWQSTRAANISAVSIDARGGRSGLDDLRAAASASFATLYHRAIGLDGNGWDFVVGSGLAYEFREHTWDHGPLDTWASVHVPGVGLELRRLDGPMQVRLRADVALTFGGARSFALDGTPGSLPEDTLTTTQRAWGYSMGWGFAASPSLEVTYGPLSLEVGAAIDTRYAILGSDPWPDRHPTAKISDSWSTVRGSAGWKLPWKDLQMTASLERNVRRGSAGPSSRTAGETVALVGFGFALR